ncbi:MAG: ABC transporter permease [Chloroflexi bacterium]|jgi:ABC-2 type transport system permease protein|nr:ABC transporter permease [Chloroflexota bacterium]
MRLSDSWRSFRTAAWLGWQIESNWTQPLLFAIYSILKPVARAAILVFMYGVITRGNFQQPLFPYIYLGNALYTYVYAVMTGVSWAIIDDREHYKTLKYFYVAPVPIPAYLFGRGVARFLTGSISVLITILAGVLFLNLSLDLQRVDWGLFFISLVLGIILLAMMGLMLGGISLLMVHHSWGVVEGVAGALFLFSGAIFPLEVLPAWLRPLGYLLPVSYWLELSRRALVGDVAHAFPTFANLSNGALLLLLLGMTVLLSFLALRLFSWCDRRARERGLIDRVTNY